MSYSTDYDKFKDKKKKKVLYNKERELRDADSSSQVAPVKQTTILTKPEREKDLDRDRVEKSQASSSQSDVQGSSKTAPSMHTLAATYIIKARDPDSRAVSPSSQKTPSVLRKENDGLVPTYQIATKPPTVDVPSNLLQLPPSMPGCVKLVYDNMQMCEAALEYLADQNDFIVVGVIGAQGVGKSYVMSALAGRPEIFRSSTPDTYGHCTMGVDMYITSSRVMFLDTAPIFASNILDYMSISSQLDKKLSGELTSSSSENASEIQSLQLCAFLLAVCHIVIVIDDWVTETSTLRCVLDSEMLKPSTSTTSGDDQIVEYFPHIVFLKNMATPSYFMPSSLQLIQEMIAMNLDDSRLHSESGISIATGKVMPNLTSASSGGCLNIFLIPYDDNQAHPDKFRGHPEFNQLVKILRHQILSAPRQSLTTTPLSERHWFLYASKILENVKKSSLFMELNKYLP